MPTTSGLYLVFKLVNSNIDNEMFSTEERNDIKNQQIVSVNIGPLFFCFSGTIIDIQWNLYNIKQSDSRMSSRVIQK